MSEAAVPRIGSGDVEITLLDAQNQPEKFVMRPSYAAARTISGTAGGLLGAIERVARLDVDAIIQVVQLGLNQGQQQRGPKDLPERIWRTGLSDEEGGVAAQCVAFLRVLMNGGRAPPTDAHDQDEAKN